MAEVIEPTLCPEPDYNTYCSEPDSACKDYHVQHTMYRIKDPKVSLEFYTKVLGMRLLKRLDFHEHKFTIYLMGYECATDIPTDEKERTHWSFSRKAVVQLKHCWGTECDPSFKGYHDGNDQPLGFGHIAIAVPDVYKACERFDSLGVNFIKKPDGGDSKFKGIAFITDPDGYWVEILNAMAIVKITNQCS